MKTLRVRNDVHGRSTEVEARDTYETTLGQWVAEVNGSEFRRACVELCEGEKNCRCEDMHGQANQDDDGKEYRIKSV